MSSNKYYREWEKNNSKKSDLKSAHLILSNKLDNDISRLDRAIDKIKTEEKAQKIFRYGNQLQSQSCPFIQINNHIGLTMGHPIQPVHIAHVKNQYVIINGCVVMRQDFP
jgi:hypothetical protein